MSASIDYMAKLPDKVISENILPNLSSADLCRFAKTSHRYLKIVKSMNSTLPLPIEVISEYILPELPLKALGNFANSSSSSAVIVRDDYFWRRLLRSDFGIREKPKEISSLDLYKHLCGIDTLTYQKYSADKKTYEYVYQNLPKLAENIVPISIRILAYAISSITLGNYAIFIDSVNSDKLGNCTSILIDSNNPFNCPMSFGIYIGFLLANLINFVGTKDFGEKFIINLFAFLFFTFCSDFQEKEFLQSEAKNNMVFQSKHNRFFNGFMLGGVVLFINNIAEKILNGSIANAVFSKECIRKRISFLAGKAARFQVNRFKRIKEVVNYVSENLEQLNFGLRR